MNETLRKIQKVAKAGKILSQIVMVLSIVGAVACLIGIGSVRWALDYINAIFQIGHISIHGLIEGGMSKPESSLYGILTASFVVCFMQALTVWFIVRFFKRELEIGTPFDRQVASLARTTGIMLIVLPIVADFLGTLAFSLITVMSLGEGSVTIQGNINLMGGIVFLVLSLIFRYGAELQARMAYLDEEILRVNGSEETV